MLNAFRLIGDMAHLAAIVLLPFKLHASRSAAGVSLKTQKLYLMVFLTRYADLCFRFISLYNSVMKITYVSLTAVTIYMMRRRPSLRASYDSSMVRSIIGARVSIPCGCNGCNDSFRLWMHGVVPCFALAVAADWHHYGYLNIIDLNFWWVFSELLEPVAIVPQLVVFRRCTDVGRLALVYVCLLACYRGMYVLNWVWRAHHESRYIHHPLIYFCCLLQAAFYVIFCWAHVTRNPSLTTDGYGIMDPLSSASELLPQEDGHDSPDSSLFRSDTEHRPKLPARIVENEVESEAAPRGDPSKEEQRSPPSPSLVDRSGAVGGGEGGVALPATTSFQTDATSVVSVTTASVVRDGDEMTDDVYLV